MYEFILVWMDTAWIYLWIDRPIFCRHQWIKNRFPCRQISLNPIHVELTSRGKVEFQSTGLAFDYIENRYKTGWLKGIRQGGSKMYHKIPPHMCLLLVLLVCMVWFFGHRKKLNFEVLVCFIYLLKFIRINLLLRSS